MKVIVWITIDILIIIGVLWSLPRIIVYYTPVHKQVFCVFDKCN